MKKKNNTEIVINLGPTNSGKTYDAIQRLMEVREGVYAGPLRMLAYENYEKIKEHLGEDAVGLITGEEEINVNAPILCCTVEMAPMTGNLLILDEVQWAGDNDRGAAWTRLLANSNYKEKHIIGSPDATNLVKSVYPDCKIIQNKRLGELKYIGGVNHKKIKKDTVIICFSRKNVINLAEEMKKIYGRERVAMLYGAMPIKVRRSEIDRVLNGEADIIVATDVLGHGINLPCKTILFAETEKFDGIKKRELDAWETAQIAGRAGRYGMHEEGEVGILVGNNSFNPRGSVVRRGLTPPPHRNVSHGVLAPFKEEIITGNNNDIKPMLIKWRRDNVKRLTSKDWVKILNVEKLVQKFDLIKSMTKKDTNKFNEFNSVYLWKLITSPLDVSNDSDLKVFILIVDSILTGDNITTKPLRGNFKKMSLEDAETVARIAQAYAWAAFNFPILNIPPMLPGDAEDRASMRIIQLLKQ